MWRRYKKRLFNIFVLVQKRAIRGGLLSAIWRFFVGLCFGLAPYVFHLADLERGYNATGGEIFIFLVPFIVWAFKESCKDVMLYDKKPGKHEVRKSQSNSICWIEQTRQGDMGLRL